MLCPVLFSICCSLLFRWLFGDVTCLGYAVCGVLFGLCSLTNLTALSSVCCLKVCFPHYGKPSLTFTVLSAENLFPTLW